MKVYMIRHGEADYTEINKRTFIGFGRDLAPLKDYSSLEIDTSKFKNAEIIISSPITRAMHTATYIVKETSLDLKVDVLLHEWMPDVNQKYRSDEELFKLYKDFLKHKGMYTSINQVWESLELLQNRVKESLDKYLDKYETIIIVSHSMICKTCVGNINIGNGEVIEFEYTKDYKFPKWF